MEANREALKDVRAWNPDTNFQSTKQVAKATEAMKKDPVWEELEVKRRNASFRMQEHAIAMTVISDPSVISRHAKGDIDYVEIFDAIGRPVQNPLKPLFYAVGSM